MRRKKIKMPFLNFPIFKNPSSIRRMASIPSYFPMGPGLFGIFEGLGMRIGNHNGYGKKSSPRESTSQPLIIPFWD
jgi:hypothetical protein